MEQARILIAIALSFLVFFLWEFFIVDKKPVQQPQQEIQQETLQEKVIEESTLQPKVANMDKSPVYPQKSSEDIEDIRIITINTPLYTTKISEKGALVKSFKLMNYRNSVDENSDYLEMVAQDIPVGTVLLGFEQHAVSHLNQKKFSAETNFENHNVIDASLGISFQHISDTGIVLEKRFTFFPDTYLINIDVIVQNNSANDFQDNIVLSLVNTLPKEKRGYGFVGPSALIDNRLEQIKTKDLKDKNIFSGKLDWISFQDRYFLSSIIPKNSENATMRILNQGVQDKELLYGQYIQPLVRFYPNSRQIFQYQVYLGPKSGKILKSIGRDLDKAINFGMFNFIAKPCVWFMNLLYGVIPNYGIAIIFLTIFTKILLWPLGTKSYKSMSEMKKIQPLMAEIREKYKDDKRKMNEEVMGLYRTYKVNPMGGCLPMLVQLPVFFALYRMLYEAIELRHAPFFGWINDLSAPDRLFRFDVAIPFMQEPYGIPVLTIIMGGTMFLQQKMSPPMGDPAQAKMMMLMPVIFTFVFINFSSGLVLYWLVNNVLSISQQYYIQKKYA